MTKFNVVDALMGSGKTNWIIQQMNGAEYDKKFIYIAPYLSECDRIIENVTERAIKQPDNRNSEGRKLRSLKTLVTSGYDVASTHSLLQTADDELIELIKREKYTLVIDEVLDVIETIRISTKDINRLKRNDDIKIDENGRVHWIGDADYDTRFTDIYLLATAGTLYFIRDKMLVKIFSDEVLRAFDEVIVMTYLFDYSQMAAWYRINEINYEKHSVKFDEETGMYQLAEYDVMKEDRAKLYRLMNVHQGKYCDQLKHIKLSSNALKELPNSPAGYDDLELIEKTVRNFLDSHKLRGYKGYWTSLSDTMDYLSPRGYSRKSKISLNLRATNDYADGYAMAYIYDRFPNPMQTSFFTDRGASFNDDGYAISDLLQWIYRSRIRNGLDIQLFLPSKRMRTLLEQWSKFEL